MVKERRTELVGDSAILFPIITPIRKTFVIILGSRSH